LSVFHQIFIEREYRCLDDLVDPKLIVDLGANVGYSSCYFLSRFPGCTIIAVEPDPGNYTTLCRNVQLYEPRCRTLRAAVWPGQERLAFDSQTTSLGKEWGRKVTLSTDSSEALSVETISILDLLSMSGYDRISLLKVDIEGAEIELFKHSDLWINRVENIVIELHGNEAEEIFARAIHGRSYKVSRCGELTVCRAL
jgi:FkbM family methyltransferase